MSDATEQVQAPADNWLTIINTLFQSFIQMVGDITQLAKLEAHLASKSLLSLVLCVFFLGSMLTSVWLSFVALLTAILIIILHLGWINALAVVFLFNLLIILIVCRHMQKLKHNLVFPATRRQISEMRNLVKEKSYE